MTTFLRYIHCGKDGFDKLLLTSPSTFVYSTSMDKTVYVCTGTCKAEISEEQYAGGLVKCGAKGCTHEGHTFEKRLKCTECGTIFAESDHHAHP